jgi:small Trp-rich protein
MWFVVIGVVMLVMNVTGFGPIGAWTWRDQWWALLAPFAAAFVWWMWADFSGWTQRKAMETVDAKRQHRRDKQLDALGMADRKKRR